MAGVYNINIPSSPPLVSVDAHLVGPTAPAILAGTVRTLADITNSREETTARKRAKMTNDNLVTQDEISLSMIREAAVMNEAVSGQYGAAGAPAWGVALVAQVTGLAAQVNGLAAQVNATNVQLTGIAAQVSAIDARQRCHLAQRFNNPKAEHPFKQLVKVNAGVGPPLPRPGQAAWNPAIQETPVGTPYPVAEPFVPVDYLALTGMTHGEISALAEWANDDFGIFAGDNIAERRRKLMLHYCRE